MNIIITGASGGIGAELAFQMAAEGDHSIIIIARNEKRLKEVENRIFALNNSSRCITIAGDLSEHTEILRIAKLIHGSFNKIDILINNAGYLINRSFHETSQKDMHQLLNVNFLAPVNLIKELLSLLRHAEHAHVVNIGSMGGVQGTLKFPGLSFYSASKGALAIMTECLAEEFKHSNISFNCLSLGSADTAMLREAFPGYKAATTAQGMASFIKEFAFKGHNYFNGKILQVALTTP